MELMESGTVRSVLEVISKTTSIESRFEIGDNVAPRTHHHLCGSAAILDIPCHQSELVRTFRILLDSRYIPPIVDPENPEIKNSDNTVLFLVSCYQYIMIAVILSVGAPYREPMLQNGSNCSKMKLI